MDPQATWDDLLSALGQHDWVQAHDAANALREWIQRGGFPPTVLGHPGLETDFERALAIAACDYVLSLATRHEGSRR